MNVVFWCEVNEAWANASLVWLWSFGTATRYVEGCKLVVWCDGESWVEDYCKRANEVIRRTGSSLELEVKVFDSTEHPRIDTSNRCISSESVGIAISRIMNYNKMVRGLIGSVEWKGLELGSDNYNVISSLPCHKIVPQSSTTTIYNTIFIHCDTDGFWCDGVDLSEFVYNLTEELKGYSDGCIFGVNEYDDIHNALANTHSSEFMEELDGVYLNCGFLGLYRVGEIDESCLYEFLGSDDSYCLEQDYLNSLPIARVCIDSAYNFTYRKHIYNLEHNEYIIPNFVHFYGENKPFLAKDSYDVSSVHYNIDGIEYGDLSYYYFGDYYQVVNRVKSVLSNEFWWVCWNNYRAYLANQRKMFPFSSEG